MWEEAQDSQQPARDASASAPGNRTLAGVLEVASLGIGNLTTRTPGGWDAANNLLEMSGERRASEDDVSEHVRQQEFMNLARDRFRDAVNAEATRRSEFLMDLKFRCGEQWRPEDKWKRDQSDRPSLTINRIPGFLKHVLNTLRQARPGIKVDPLGNGMDEEVAEIRQGVIRHIEMQSQADIAYDTAFENMCTMGLGWARIIDGWAPDSVDEKELYVEWVPNTFSVYSDPAAARADWSDAKYRFVVEDITLAEFKRRFGKDREACSAENFKSIGDDQPIWMVDGKIRIAEYFHVEEIDDMVCEDANGTVGWLSEWEAAAKGGAQLYALPQFVKTRRDKRKQVIWTLIDGLETLEERPWFGQYIPVVPCIGNQIEMNGEKLLLGMVRYAREAQRMYNYAYSCMVESIALAPKAPFIAEFDQIEEFRPEWARANTDPMAFLPYRATTADGNLVPAPQRQQAEPPIAAFVQLLQLSDQNLKATFNIYDASLGQRGPQESGVAIDARKIESDTANYDWIDNFHRFLVAIGTQLDDLLQYYYNNPGRIVRIVREDLTQDNVPMNAPHQNDDGHDVVYDLSKGKASISISSGPSFMTRRQESAKAMLEMVKVYPSLMQVAGPQIIREQDWPGKDAIAAQLEKTMPAELRQQDKNGPPPIPPEVQQKLQQYEQMIQTMAPALKEATDKHNSEERDQQWDTFREQMRQETALAIAQLKTGSQEAQFLNSQIFAELQQLRATLQPRLVDGQGGSGSASTNSPAPASAAPAAPALPQAPPPGAEPQPGLVPAT